MAQKRTGLCKSTTGNGESTGFSKVNGEWRYNNEVSFEECERLCMELPVGPWGDRCRYVSFGGAGGAEWCYVHATCENSTSDPDLLITPMVSTMYTPSPAALGAVNPPPPPPASSPAGVQRRSCQQERDIHQ